MVELFYFVNLEIKKTKITKRVRVIKIAHNSN